MAYLSADPASRPLRERDVYTVSRLNREARGLVEGTLGSIWLEGEISNFARPGSGHWYFSLKDDAAQVRCAMFRQRNAGLGMLPKDGMQVLVRARASLYEPRGEFQLIVDHLEESGEGELRRRFERLKRQLAAEGLFETARKRPLPRLPRRIGVVTSPTGAALRDILQVLRRRFAAVPVILYPVPVQGAGAAGQIAAAIALASARAEVDVLVVGRGGGSLEDLWSFNEEIVVRAVAESPIPVISAVGHETDTTLCDHAADRRAPTPTAAAEIAVPVLRDLAATLDDFALRQRKVVMRPVELGRERLAARAERLPAPEQLLQPQAQKLDELGERLRRGLVDRAARGRERLADLRLSPAILRGNLRDAKQRLASARLAPALVQRPIAESRERLAALARLAEQLHPEKPLSRGYAMVLDAAGKAVTSAAKAEKEPVLGIKFADGTVQAVPGASPRKAASRDKPPPESGQPRLF